jgi:hypothetical protein
MPAARGDAGSHHSRRTIACRARRCIERQFRRLETEWETETAHLSSSTKIMGHPRSGRSCRWVVVPLMIGDLRRGPSLWVWVLPELTGADPVAPGDRGDIAKMTDGWADGHGYQR